MILGVFLFLVFLGFVSSIARDRYTLMIGSSPLHMKRNEGTEGQSKQKAKGNQIDRGVRPNAALWVKLLPSNGNGKRLASMTCVKRTEDISTNDHYNDHYNASKTFSEINRRG